MKENCEKSIHDLGDDGARFLLSSSYFVFLLALRSLRSYRRFVRFLTHIRRACACKSLMNKTRRSNVTCPLNESSQRLTNCRRFRTTSDRTRGRELVASVSCYRSVSYCIFTINYPVNGVEFKCLLVHSFVMNFTSQ